MRDQTYPYVLAGEAVHANDDLVVSHPATGCPVARVALADASVLDQAIARAGGAREAMLRMPGYRRRAVLERVRDAIVAEREGFARDIVDEAGKPITDALAEVDRAIDTFTIAMEEATRIEGRHASLEVSERGAGYRSLSMRVPVGVCAFITPFNFPLNLVAHKVAPAIACGCPFVLKPADKTPLAALRLGAILSETDLPAGSFSVLPCLVPEAAALIEDDRIALLSFTGSAQVGWSLMARARRKRVVLELGGNAPCIIDADADLDEALPRIGRGAFGYAGQSCISVQRLFVHTSVYTTVREWLVEDAQRWTRGDLTEPSTTLAPLIDEPAAERVEAWIRAARQAGARVLCGGEREGAYLAPAILEDVARDAQLMREEAFGPVLIMIPFSSFDEALVMANDSAYGLQAGVFTRDLEHAFRAFERLEVGGVIVNDVPTVRVDAMPYGGVKRSGLGREGVRFAIEHMTEERLMVLRGAGC